MAREVWTIELGAAVGPFRLGASIAEALHALKSRLPVRPFEILYNAGELYKSDVVIDSPEDGFRLKFDPVRQVLTMVEFYDVNRIALKYGRVVIFGGDVAATFMSVYNLFGPTVPGHYEAAEKNGSTPAATGFMVFVGSDYRSPKAPVATKKYVSSILRIDILYDSLHTVSKVIMKANALGHPDFGSYHKCNFRLCFQTATILQKSGIKKTRIPEITAETPWKDVRKMFGSASDLRPVIHDNGLGLHPFGSSLCYSPTPGCIFEVRQTLHVLDLIL
ncbi:hypothetical protein FI667_g6123, partial [Globisporangium splendens]